MPEQVERWGGMCKWNFVLVLCARFGTGCATFGRAPCGEVTAGQETRSLNKGSHSPTSQFFMLVPMS